jgi:hypothetical protein
MMPVIGRRLRHIIGFSPGDPYMIFRRFAGNLRRQDWTAVVVELVVVVAGVFIGLQASNWNTDRETDTKAAVFKQHLTDDLREEAWGYQLMIDYNQQVRASADRAEGALTGAMPLEDEAFLVDAYRASQYKQKLRRRATYDELISTGAIGLIRDRPLRDLAMRVYSMVTIENFVREGMASRYREAFRTTVSLVVQRTLAQTCGDTLTPVGDYTSLTHSLDYPCHTGLSETAIREAATALRGNPLILPSLRQRAVDIDTRLGDMLSNNREIRDGLIAMAEGKPLKNAN